MADRKEQILDIAADLLLARSFSAFSYQDISDRLGIRKATIHHHFPTKEALGVALVERFCSHHGETLRRLADEHPDPWSRLEGYFEMVTRTVRSKDRICPAGRLQSEYGVVPKGMRERIGVLYRLTVDWLATVLTEGRDNGTMDYPGPPRHQACLVHAALPGALQNALVEGPEPFEAVLSQLRGSMRAGSVAS